MTVSTEKQEALNGNYLRESFSEMKRVVWPSRDETVRLTGVVIGVSIAVGAVLGLVDFILTALVQLVS